MSILIVEDDQRIIDFLVRGLSAEGYRVDAIKDGVAGLAAAKSGMFKLILLDIMLPGMDGREVCRELRATGSQTPVLMLTALDATEDIVRGLRFGADDYLTKPFSFDELLARIEALLRRSGPLEMKIQTLQVGDLLFNRETLVVTRAGQRIELTSTEYALLELFMASEGRLMSRAHILENVWGASQDPLTNIVDVYVARLRTKIDADHALQLIKTIRGRGYRMDATTA